MIEHPVPQNVTAYQFRLVGDMTLKQFLELAGGIFAAWLIWTFDIPDFIKWPFVILAAIAGFALAFLPLEDRPLDHWIISFFQAVYRPTLLWWKKISHADIFQFTPRETEKKGALEAAVKTPAAGLQTLLQAYQLQAFEQEAEDPLEKALFDRQKTIPGLFEEVQVPKKLALETTFPKPLEVQPVRPTTRLFLHPLRPPEDPEAIIRGEITLPLRQPKIPPRQTVTVDLQAAAPKKPQPSREPATPSVSVSLPAIQGIQETAGQPTTPAPQLTTSLPAAPNQPNILAGMVLTADGRIVEGAIIEVRDASGLPVRALKTNKLGKFAIATPLANGTYELLVEKDDLRFAILKIDASGAVMQPIEVRAKETENNER